LHHGFVLLVVLWVMVGVSALGLALAFVARRVVSAARNRRAATLAAWTAEACAARARVVIDDVLADAVDRATAGPANWRMLDQIMATAPVMVGSGCMITLRPAGRALNLNTANAEQLTRLFLALHLLPAQADSLTAALLDWRDPDELPRPAGAEAPWYVQHGRAPPRNGPFADARELARVRGIDHLATLGLDTLLDVEPGRIDLNHAPLPVLASVPGLGDEALARIAEQRARHVPITDLLTLAATLSPDARTALVARYADLARLTTTEPDAWLLTSRAQSGSPAVTAVLELRLARAGTRAAIVRRRSWLE
jgi:general secretion pathway protein K